jgi:hypothetical protein
MAQRGGKRPGAGRKQGTRNKATDAQLGSLTEMAQQHTALALRVLAEIAQKSDSDAARVSAANALLDRGYGKPAQSHEHTGRDGGPLQTFDLTHASDDDLKRLEAFIGPLAIAAGSDAGPRASGDQKA